MRDKALEFIRREKLFGPGDRVIAAFSGGADSAALLHFLQSLREEWHIELSACHINHMLRGEESFRDEEFCRGFCRRLGVPLLVRRADVRALSGESGESEELCARRVRYGLWEELAADGAVIATAHTLSDRAETAIINLARGTGLKGLCSIPPRRGAFVRPLLGCTREETEAYCRANCIDYVTDSSNLSRDYTRNRIRLDVLPVLREINPGFLACAGRAFENLSRDEEYLEGQAARAEQELRAGEGLSCRGLRELHPAVSFRVLRRFLQLKGMPYDQKRAALILCCAAGESGAVTVARGCRARVLSGVLYLEAAQPEAVEEFEFPAAAGEEYEVPGCFRLRLLLLDYEEFEKTVNNERNLLKNGLDYDRMISTLWIRQRRPGDFFHPAGRGVGKSLKKLFQEHGIPPALRERVPVLADASGVVWIAGFGCDERVLPGPGCRRVLAVEWEPLYAPSLEQRPHMAAAKENRHET